MSAYLNTRISVHTTHLWQAADFQALLDADATEMAEALAARGLGALAVGYTGDDPRSLEARIIAQLLDETLVLIRPLIGPERVFLNYWTERFEVSNVKALLRGKLTGEGATSLLTRLIPMGAFARLDLNALSQAEDLAELLRELEAGPYADIVRQARRAFEESQDLFTLDAALDRGWYEGFAHRARALESAAGAPFRRLMASLIDRTNLVWLLRYRFNYGLQPAQVYYLLVDSHYSLSSALLRQLTALDSLEAVIAALPASLRTAVDGANDIHGVFARLEAEAIEIAGKVLHSGATAIARAFAYLILREHDLRSVRAALRGRHLGLARDDIRLAMQQWPAAGVV